MKRIFILCALIFLHVSLPAQNKISGYIREENGKPLAGASVYIPEIHKGTVSRDDGYYEINRLPNGKIKIQFSYVGYGNHIETVILKGSDKILEVVLQPTVIATEEIVVSGGYSSSQHENAIKIETIKLKPFENPVSPNFTEVLTKIPGVDMISKGSGVSKPVIRGLSMNDILVLNNGVRFENYQYSSHHPLGIDEFGIEEVEVIKGPASLIYGSDAMGGVLNFIKEKPAEVGSIIGDYNLQLFSNSLGMVNNLGIKGASKNFFGGIRAGHKTHADYLQGGGAFVPNSRFNEYSVKSSAGYTDKIGTFKLFYDFNQQNLGLVEEEAVEEIEKRGRKCEIFYQQLKTHMLSNQNKIYFGRFKADLNVAYQNTELTHFGEENEYELQMKLGTLNYETKIYLPSNEKSEYIIGFQGMNQTNTNINDRETILLPDATTNNYSGFGLIQYTFFKKLKLQAGARYDYKTLNTEAVGFPDSSDYRPALDKNYGSFSGSFGANFNASEKLLFRANIAAAYRTPTLAELTANGPHEAIYEKGDEFLKPEKSWEIDVSMHYHTSNLSIDIAGFYNNIDDYIFISPTNDTVSSGKRIYQYMQKNAYLYGGEAGLHYHPAKAKWLHLEASYSTVIGKQKSGDYLTFIPADKINLEIKFMKERLIGMHHVYASISSNAALDQYKNAPEETPTKGYVLLNIALGGQIKIQNQLLSISINANNILDTKYVDHLSTLKEVGLQNPGRNFALTVKVPFKIL